MLKFSVGQMAVMERTGREQFIERLTANLAADKRFAAGPDHAALARQALEFGDGQGLTFEIDIAAVAEVMLAVASGRVAPERLGWFRDIVGDARPRKGRRIRECLAIELRLGAALMR